MLLPCRYYNSQLPKVMQDKQLGKYNLLPHNPAPQSLEKTALGRVINTRRHLAYLNLLISNIKNWKEMVKKIQGKDVYQNWGSGAGEEGWRDGGPEKILGTRRMFCSSILRKKFLKTLHTHGSTRIRLRGHQAPEHLRLPTLRKVLAPPSTRSRSKQGPTEGEPGTWPPPAGASHPAGVEAAPNRPGLTPPPYPG